MNNYQLAEKDYKAGMKYKDIAEKYGVTLEKNYRETDDVEPNMILSQSRPAGTKVNTSVTLTVTVSKKPTVTSPSPSPSTSPSPSESPTASPTE